MQIRAKSKLFIPAVAAIALLAQKPAPEQAVKSVNRLVEVNVIVRDKNGPIANLTRDDFKVFDKGKEQRIVSFVAASNQGVQPQRLGPDVFCNRPNFNAPPSGVTVVLMDALNTPLAVQTYARSEILKALAGVKAPDRVVVGVLGDHIRLLDYGTHGGEDVSLGEWMTSGGSSGASNISTQLRFTTEALVAASADVRHFAGRKNLVWVAGNYPVEVDHFGADGPPGWQDNATNFSAAAGSMNAPVANPTLVDRQVFRKTFSAAMQALNFAALAVYEVDARGVADAASGPTATNTSRSAAARGSDASLVPRGYGALHVLADDSGGRTSDGGNDIQKAIRVAIADAQVTYTLGYYPDVKSLDSQFHSLKVEVSRKDVDLHYRKGYVALPETGNAETQRSEAIREALVNPLSVDGIGLMGGLQKVDQPKPGGLRATVLISAADLELQQNGDHFDGELEVVLSPRSADGKDLGATRQPLALKLPQAQYETVRQKGLTFSATLEPTGEVAEVRAVVCDHASGRLGSLIMRVK